MDVKAYIYIDSSIGTLCLKCAVKEIIKDPDGFSCDLALEQGDTDSGTDMRSTPNCTICGKYFSDFCIA